MIRKFPDDLDPCFHKKKRLCISAFFYMNVFVLTIDLPYILLWKISFGGFP